MPGESGSSSGGFIGEERAFTHSLVKGSLLEIVIESQTSRDDP